MKEPTGSWLGNMVYNMLGMNDPPKIPKAPDKTQPPPRPLVRLLVGFLLLVIGPIICWIIWQVYLLIKIGFIT